MLDVAVGTVIDIDVRRMVLLYLHAAGRDNTDRRRRPLDTSAFRGHGVAHSAQHSQAIAIYQSKEL